MRQKGRLGLGRWQGWLMMLKGLAAFGGLHEGVDILELVERIELLDGHPHHVKIARSVPV